MNITSAGLLVRLNIRTFPNSREDDSITSEVKALHKLAGKAGRWIKVKLDPESLRDVQAAANAARRDSYSLTLPWVDGYRLLPLAARAGYETAIGTEAKQAFDKAVRDFCEDYPKHVEAARAMHNGTFRESDYPSDPGALFGFQVEMTPVPSGDHFTQVVSGPALEQLRAQLEAVTEQRVAEAKRDLWERLLAPVRAMADKLADKEAIFRDSLVGNVEEICGLAAALNVTGDPQLTAAAAAISRQLAGLNPDTLRSSVVVRKAAATAAKEILARFAAPGTRSFAD